MIIHHDLIFISLWLEKSPPNHCSASGHGPCVEGRCELFLSESPDRELKKAQAMFVCCCIAWNQNRDMGSGPSLAAVEE